MISLAEVWLHGGTVAAAIYPQMSFGLLFNFFGFAVFYLNLNLNNRSRNQWRSQHKNLGG